MVAFLCYSLPVTVKHAAEATRRAGRRSQQSLRGGLPAFPSKSPSALCEALRKYSRDTGRLPRTRRRSSLGLLDSEESEGGNSGIGGAIGK